MSAGEFKPSELPALVLAYLGDVVWEAYVRRRLIAEAGISSTSGGLHKQALLLVSAEAQASVLDEFSELLSEEELAVMKRGRRARARRSNRPASMSEYRNSTGFEALLGYLDLCARRDRLEELMDKAFLLERGKMEGNGKA